MRQSKDNQLNEDFLYELYFCSTISENVCSMIVQHMDKTMLPTREFQEIHSYIVEHYSKYRCCPTIGTLQQGRGDKFEYFTLLQEIKNVGQIKNIDAIIDGFGEYIKNVKLQQTFNNVAKLYNEGNQPRAREEIAEYAEWLSGLSFNKSKFIDIHKGFLDRFESNKAREAAQRLNKERPVSRFYIDALDTMNNGRNLRKQLTCWLAATGVGKSHAARHIGACASREGLNVLHFQLEGSEDEVVDAYSGAIVGRNAYRFEKGKISETEIKVLAQEVSEQSGNVTVRSFPRFNNQVSTVDIKNGIDEYEKSFGRRPDIVIIDSLDLLTDSSKKKWGADHERSKRIAVANDLKDLAGDANVWMVVTYQATIENRDWLNDEKNVLTEYNCSEAKGLSRPCTHLISLNQSDAERSESSMRLFVAKSRFFPKGDPIKIATDYDNEVFYDHVRSMMFKQFNN